MDFTTSEAANDLGRLVDTIVDSVCTPEHQRELESLGGDWREASGTGRHRR